jgi:hypothetical protein
MKKESDLRLQEKKMDNKLKEKENKEKRNNQGPAGRPINTGAPQEKSRETKPQGMAWLLDYEVEKEKAIIHVNRVEKVISKQVLKALGKETKRSLTKHESDGMIQITFAVASQTFGKLAVSADMVREILSTSPTIDASVYDLYLEMKSGDMTLAGRKSAMASAIAYNKLQGE